MNHVKNIEYDLKLLKNSMDSSDFDICGDVPIMFITQSQVRELREVARNISRNNNITALCLRDISIRADKALDRDESHTEPYCGTNFEEFIAAAQNTMNDTLFLAFHGSITQQEVFLQRAKRNILRWATCSPLPGTLLALPQPSRRLTNTGLTLSRFLDRIVETFRLLTPILSTRDHSAMVSWIHALGHTIKASHQHWLAYHAVEGPQNHMSWHVFGMTISALVANDTQLLNYALWDSSNMWNFTRLVSSAIYRSGTTNLYRSCCDDATGEAYDFGGLCTTGEIYDRYRTLVTKGGKEPCGLHYCMFNLQALMYTAHICAVNNIRHRDGSHLMETANNALLDALHYYGDFYVRFPVGTVPYIDYAPYRNQCLPYEAMIHFILAYLHHPNDTVLQRVIDLNITHAEGRRKHDHSLHKAHPLHMPTCYLALMLPIAFDHSDAKMSEA